MLRRTSAEVWCGVVWLAGLWGGLSGVEVGWGQEGVRQGGGRPVPGEAAVVDARRALRERFAKDYADVTAAGKRRLAAAVYREAGKSGGDAALWVALQEARELSVSAGEAELALACVDDLGRQFEVDAEAIRVATLQSLANGRLSPQQAGLTARAGRAMVEARLAADDFDGALRAATLAELAGRQSADAGLSAELAMLTEFCRDVVHRAGGYEAAMKLLGSAEGAEPTKPEQLAQANQVAGEFLVLVKQEWGRGLVMLSRGADRSLREAAAAELAGARGAELHSAAAAWDKWARSQSGPGRRIAQRHALKLYSMAAADLEGEGLAACLESAAGVVNTFPAGADWVDTRQARLEVGEEAWRWWESLGVGGVSVREDVAELESTQVLVEWKPRLDEADEVPPPPEGVRLTYVVRVLCVDGRGEPTVLEEAGRVTWRSPNRPLRLTGPRVSAVKRANDGVAVARAAWVEFRINDVAVGQRVYKLPVKQAWWLRPVAEK